MAGTSRFAGGVASLPHPAFVLFFLAFRFRDFAGDDAFLRDYGAEIILDTARFWGDRAELETENGQRRYAIRDVIGKFTNGVTSKALPIRMKMNSDIR